MAVEAPTNCWTTAEDAIAQAVANSPTFQQLVGAADSAAAAAKVFGDQVDEPLNGAAFSRDELEARKAYCQVFSADESPYGKRRGESLRWLPFGTAIIFIEREVAVTAPETADIPMEIERWFKNRVGNILDEVAAWLDDNGGPYITGYIVSGGPGFNDRSRWPSQGQWQGIEWTLEWGYR